VLNPATPASRIARKVNISMTLLAPTAEMTRVHGYMKIISMSKARNSIVIAYQRRWNRLTACSAGGRPPVNGAAVNGDRATPASHDTP
jgi:hypothetical protein